jgi:hypothetical protein
MLVAFVIAPAICQLTLCVANSPIEPFRLSHSVTITLKLKLGLVAETLPLAGLTTTAVDVPTRGNIVASVFDAAKSALKSMSIVPFVNPPINVRALSPIAVVSKLSALCDNVTLVT